MNDDVPDCFDINDWLVLHEPQVYEAIKYLHWSAIYACGLQIWEQRGKPDISS